MTERNDSCDFPAAHSMDTTWFAVDLDGNVALFESGEAGAVPSVVADEYYPEEDAFDALPKGEHVFDRAAYLAMNEGEHVPVARVGLAKPGPERTKVLVFLADSPETEKRLAGMQGERTASAEGVAFLWETVDAPTFEALHADGACLGCFFRWPGQGESAAGALYIYRHTAENWVSGPYARASSPSMPAKADAMPDDVLEHAVKFEGRFADVATLQPAELWPCESWMPGWLSTDGVTVRPFEGREDEFEEVKENLDGHDGLVVKEPLAPPHVAVALKGRPVDVHATPPRAGAGAGDEETSFADLDAPPLRTEERTATASDPPPPPKPWWKIW